MLSLSDFHPTSLLLSRVGKVSVWFTHLLGDNGKEWGVVYETLMLLTVSLVVSKRRMTLLSWSSW